MCAAAGVTIGTGGLTVGGDIIAIAVFSILAAATVVLPVLAYHFAADQRHVASCMGVFSAIRSMLGRAANVPRTASTNRGGV